MPEHEWRGVACYLIPAHVTWELAIRDSNFNNFSRLTIRDNGQQGIFLAQDNDRQDSPCTGNVFSELTVTGSKGPGFRVKRW